MNILAATLQPTAIADPPRAFMGGSRRNIPVIEVSDHPITLTIQLGNHARPAEYLRQFAARLLLLAAEVEAAKEPAS